MILLTTEKDISMLKQETEAYEELAKQLFLESVDLHNAQVNTTFLLVVKVHNICDK